MSLGIVFKGPEGLVLAADSRVTLTTQFPNQAVPSQTLLLPSTFDNATKLLRVNGQDHVGVVTYGLGAIGAQQPRTAHSFLPEFESELPGNVRLKTGEFAQKLSDFFMRQWNSSMPRGYAGPNMVFLIGGFDIDEPYGRVFEIDVPGVPAPKEWHANPMFGAVWGGQREFTDRLLQGFDPQLISIVQKNLALSDEKVPTLETTLRNALSVPIPYQFLPLQDCVDLSIFLIRTTMTIQTWMLGVRGVGGAIDVATITRTEGFKFIRQKRISGEHP